MFYKYILVFLLLNNSIKLINMVANFRCDKKFCQDFIETGACPDISECMKKKHILMDIPEPCSCCKICLTLLDENEECDSGEIGQVSPSAICDGHLQCINNKCQPFKTACGEKQQEWDKNQEIGVQGIYTIRPECDDNGNYIPGYCQPATGICYCVNEDGQRIFGDTIFRDMDSMLNLSCECSRMVASTSHLLSEWSLEMEMARCTSRGEYEPLQCIDGRCFCVDSKTAEIPNNHYVNENGLKLGDLPCYTSKMDITLDRPCEDERRGLINLLKAFDDDNMILLDTPIPDCTPDGRYAPVQISNGNKKCVDPDGKLIDTYTLPLSSYLTANMNCKCARSQWLVKSGPFLDYKVSCLTNGNYDALQCRRGWCFCIDEEGNQSEMEVPESQIEKLSCYNKL